MKLKKAQRLLKVKKVFRNPENLASKLVIINYCGIKVPQYFKNKEITELFEAVTYLNSINGEMFITLKSGKQINKEIINLKNK